MLKCFSKSCSTKCSTIRQIFFLNWRQIWILNFAADATGWPNCQISIRNCELGKSWMVFVGPLRWPLSSNDLGQREKMDLKLRLKWTALIKLTKQELRLKDPRSVVTDPRIKLSLYFELQPFKPTTTAQTVPKQTSFLALTWPIPALFLSSQRSNHL